MKGLGDVVSWGLGSRDAHLRLAARERERNRHLPKLVVLFFVLVENKSGLTVSKAMFQLVDQIIVCTVERSFFVC